MHNTTSLFSVAEGPKSGVQAARCCARNAAEIAPKTPPKKEGGAKKKEGERIEE